PGARLRGNADHTRRPHRDAARRRAGTAALGPDVDARPPTRQRAAGALQSAAGREAVALTAAPARRRAVNATATFAQSLSSALDPRGDPPVQRGRRAEMPRRRTGGAYTAGIPRPAARWPG